MASYTQLTPLQTAALFGSATLVGVLLGKARPAANAALRCAAFEGATALHLAALAGSAAAVHVLLRHGAPAAAEDDLHRTALDAARARADDEAAAAEAEGSDPAAARRPWEPILALVRLPAVPPGRGFFFFYVAYIFISLAYC